MKIEEGGLNFSTNDANNVQIPDSLGATAYEFLDTFNYLLKSSYQSNTKYLPSCCKAI